MNDINLVPNQYKKAIKRKKYIVLGMIMSILIIVGLLFLAYLPVYYTKIQEDRQMMLDQLLSHKELEPIVTVLETMEIMKEQQLDIQLILAQIDVPSHITRKTLDIIIGNAPKGLRINKVVIQGLENTINISGKAQGVKSIAAYIVLLYGTDQFESISYTTKHQSLQTQGWIDYDLDIQLKPLINDSEEAL